jgi:arylsulfatase A-like enzyme
MYDSTLHVPLLVRYPAAIQSGERRLELVSLVDVFPTVLALLGQADEEQAGRSLFQADRRPTEYVMAENERPLNGIELMRRDFPDFDVSTIDERTRRVRTRDHALIWREHHEAALYDLAADPGEERDIAAHQPEVRDRLLELLARWKQGVGEPKRNGPARPDDDETLGRLRALGYVQ